MAFAHYSVKEPLRKTFHSFLGPFTIIFKALKNERKPYR